MSSWYGTGDKLSYSVDGGNTWHKLNHADSWRLVLDEPEYRRSSFYGVIDADPTPVRLVQAIMTDINVLVRFITADGQKEGQVLITNVGSTISFQGNGELKAS